MNSAQATPCGVGFPIRTSADQRSLASPRGFSQRATSFFASWRQGIHRTPFSYSNNANTARAQDQTAPCGFPHPHAWTSVSQHRHHSCLSQLTHTSDKLRHSHAKATAQAQPRTTHPPDPIHRLKEQARSRPKTPSGIPARDARGHPNQAAPTRNHGG